MSKESKFLEKVKKEREALVKKTFSMSLFVELMKDYINEPELETHFMKVENGKVKKISRCPVKDFRKILYNVLVDYGVDEQEAATVLSSYKFKSKDIDGMYSFMTDFIYYYMMTGRNFKLVEKEDIVANVFLKPQEEAYKTYEIKRKDKPVQKIEYKLNKHYRLGQKSTCSKWNKEKKDNDGKYRKIMEKVLEDL